MINELIEQIGGRERLEAFSVGHYCSVFECRNMARALLAVLDAKPLGYIDPASMREYRGVIAGGSWSPAPHRGEYNQTMPIYSIPPASNAQDALREAVNAIYFTDSSDYFSALWSIVRFLSPETADLLAKDERAAFDRVNANLQHAAAPAPGGDLSS